MTTIRDSMANPWWAQMFDRYNYNDPSNAHYGTYNHHALNKPITISSNDQVAYRLNGFHNGVAAYSVGAVSPRAVQYQCDINRCVDRSGAPDLCSKTYLGRGFHPNDSNHFDRLGQ